MKFPTLAFFKGEVFGIRNSALRRQTIVQFIFIAISCLRSRPIPPAILRIALRETRSRAWFAGCGAAC